VRLLLSSWFLTPDSRPPALPGTLRTGRAGIVLNALDGYGPSRARDYARENRTLETFGYSGEELDLRDYFSAPGELAQRLAAMPCESSSPGPSSPMAATQRERASPDRTSRAST
jgi:dipeptidase E